MNVFLLKLVDPRFAHQARPAVDLGAARSALGRLAVPAAGQVIGEVRLNVVHCIKHNHALHRWDFEALFPAARVIAAKDLQHDGAVARGRL